jgi:parallel beta-helix repeat protein
MRRLVWGLIILAALGGGGLPAPAEACPTADDLEIAAAIAGAATAGGGRVELPARTFNTCQPIVLASNVHLRGAGRGATVIRPAASLVGPLAGFGAAIVGSAVANVTVADLTLDQRTSNRVGNGIAFVPRNSDFSGTISTNILVENTQVIGAPVVGGHQYMIWNMRGQHVKILNNWIDGGFMALPSTPTAQEGIESYGGYDVTVAGNTVEGIAGTCLNFGSAGHPNTRTVGLFIRDNYANRCGVGVNVGTANPADPQLNAHTLITGNIIVYAWIQGIIVLVAARTSEIDLYIAGNTIRNVGPATLPFVADGIVLGADTGVTTVATTIKDNRVYGVRGIGFGIRLWNYPNARVLDNTVVDVGRDGIYTENSSDVEIRGNRVEATGLRGIYVGATDAEGPAIRDNVILNWGAGAEGIRVEGGRNGVVQGNLFRRTDGMQPSPIGVTPTSCGITVSSNVAMYRAEVANISSVLCPW